MSTCIFCQNEHNRKSKYCNIKCKDKHRNILKKDHIKEVKKKYKQNHQDSINEYNQKWREQNPDYQQSYRQKNYQTIQQNNQIWRQENILYTQEYQKDYYQTNKEERDLYCKKYREKNKEELAIKAKKRYEEDINHRLASILRCRLNGALKKGWKVGSAVKDLGMIIDEFRQYLESKFEPGMNWENQGKKGGKKNGWHIDHIYPLSKIDLQDEEKFKKANHYTNLQPLWAIDNFKKSNKIL